MSDKSNTPADRELRLERVLADYLRSVEAGRPIEKQTLFLQHPDLAVELKSFFSNREEMERLAAPLLGSSANEPTIGFASIASSGNKPRVRYFGDYELLDEIARGGMGVVYKARQVSLNRPVALKMILTGQLASAEDVQRFRQEAEAAANLDHPHIVPIYEIGEHDGQHFFSMKLIEGGSLRAAIREQPPATSQKQSAKLMVTIARAVHHAHQRGLLHRDLKPNNILLDTEGQPNVTDFGLAKRVEGESDLTQSGAVIGTPSYMAPEQAQAEKVLTTAVDIYSLGVILYELITGRPPFRGVSPTETILQMLSSEPPRPSTINRNVDRDLETICLKCLEKEPERRYDSAAALAEDLEHWLHGEPILARPSGQLERLRKLVRRHPIMTGMMAAVMISLIAGSAVSTWFGLASHRAAKSEFAARQYAQEKRQQAERLAEEKTRLAVAEQIANNSLRKINTRLLLDRGLEELNQGKVLEGLFHLNGALQPISDEYQNVVRANLALWKSHVHELQATRYFKTSFLSIVRNPVGSRVLLTLAANGSTCGEVRLWDTETQQVIGNSIRLSDKLSATAIALHPDQTTLIIATKQGQLHRWHLTDDHEIGEPITLADRLGQSDAPVHHLAVSSDGRTLIVASRHRIARLYDLETWTSRGNSLRTRGFISCVSFAPDSKSLFLGLGGGEGYVNRGEILSVNTETAGFQENPISFPGQVLSLQVNSDGAFLAVGDSEGVVTVLDAKKRVPTGIRVLHDAPVNSVCFVPRSHCLISSSNDGTLHFTDVRTGTPVAGRLPHAQPLSAVLCTQNGNSLLTATADGVLRTWRLSAGHHPQQQLTSSVPIAQVINDDQNSKLRIAWLSAESEPGGIQDIDAVSGEPIGPPVFRGPPDSLLFFSPNGKHVASWQPVKSDFTPRFQLWDTESGTSQTIELESGSGNQKSSQAAIQAAMNLRMLYSAQFSPDSRYLILAALPIVGPQGRIWIYDTKRQQLVAPPISYTHPVNPRALEAGLQLPQLQIDPTSRRLLCADLLGLRIFDLSTGKPLHSGWKLSGFVRDVCFSTDGQFIAVSTTNNTVAVLRADQGSQEVPEIKELQHQSSVALLEFSPNGQQLATAADDRSVRIWDTESAKLSGRPMFHDERITQLVFHPNGDRLAVVCDRNVILWDLATRQRLGPVMRHSLPVSICKFAPDGQSLTTVTGKQLHKWSVGLMETCSPREHRQSLEIASGFEPDENGAVWMHDARPSNSKLP